MPEADRNSPIVRAIEFCTQFDAAFPSAIAGAPAGQIERIEQAMPRPMSGVLRDFLSRLSVRHAWLDFGSFSTGPDDLLALRSETLGMLPDKVELLAVTMNEVEADIFLLDADGDRGGVAFHPILEDPDTEGFDHQELEWLAGSLQELICLQALNRHYSTRQPHQATFTEREPRAQSLDRTRAIARRLGFAPYWFSSRQTHAAVRNDVVLIARQPPQRPLTLAVAGAAAAEWREAVLTIEQELDLIPLGL
jgi:hypothetical protein